MTFPCPAPENYAAVAKQMHDTALRAESAIYNMEQLLRSAVNRPTLISVSTFALTDMPPDIDNVLSPAILATFANFPLTSTSDAPNSDDDVYPITGEGIYEFGMSGTVVPQGAILTNSHRTFKIQQLRADPSAFLDPVIFTAGYTVYEPNYPGGMDFSLSTILRLRTTDTVQCVLNHGNTSDLTLNAGATFWMQKVSDVDITRVVL